VAATIMYYFEGARELRDESRNIPDDAGCVKRGLHPPSEPAFVSLVVTIVVAGPADLSLVVGGQLGQHHRQSQTP
jgi:hypothetical protein